MGEMADEIEAAFKDHFDRTPIDPDYDYPKEVCGWEGRDGELVADVISSAAGIGLKPAEDIRVVLWTRHFDMELA
ncbi:MAG TPA: hypothetical protein VK747_19355, partial [Blastocatellia bacterium]|nr:hypothetical protein [Blastocatellia bacterium]